MTEREAALHAIKRRRKEHKQLEAAKRQLKRDARSTSEQLAVLDTRPGESKRERKRLNAVSTG